VEDVETAKISLRVLDKRTFKDAVIGMYEFDMAFICFQDKHCMQHQWLALSNPEAKDYNEVCGYLKVSISVTATGEDQVQLTEDSGEGNSMILMPPAIKKEFY
jgi:hypothetical protein